MSDHAFDFLQSRIVENANEAVELPRRMQRANFRRMLIMPQQAQDCSLGLAGGFDAVRWDEWWLYCPNSQLIASRDRLLYEAEV
jgi:hypothetical protein